MASNPVDFHDSKPSMSHARSLSGLSATSFLSAEDAANSLFASIPGFDDFGNDDDSADNGLSFDDGDEARDEVGDLKSAKKSKRPASTAEKKATHNAVERARRESLNARFLVLADMLPGMTHVKRASKAAIVNKSIDLIEELRESQNKLSKENDKLRAEIAALRNRVTTSPGPAPAPSAAQAPATCQPPTGQSPANVAAMHMQNMLLGMPAFAAQDAQSHQQQMQAAAAAAAMFSGPPSGPFNGFFGAQTSAPPTASSISSAAGPDSFDNRASSVSPASHSSSLPGNGGFFDAASGNTTVASPASYHSHSPSGGMLVNTSGTPRNSVAASPASSHSVQTPPAMPSGAFSPASMPGFSTGSSSVSDASSTSPNPALAAFDASSNPAYLASHFGPQDLAKAQAELQQFIAYQQRIAGLSMFGAQMPPHPSAPFAGATPAIPAFQLPGGNAGSPLPNIPAWQLMMAQQQAMSTAFPAQASF